MHPVAVISADKSTAKRAKTGCITCRIRRVKCDEERPHCQRCTRTGRTCDGYSTLPFSRKDLGAAIASSLHTAHNQVHGQDQATLIGRLIGLAEFSNVLDRRYFDFFRSKTATDSNIVVDSRFWDRVLLQASHTEPAIRHAVLALSSLHQAQHDVHNAAQHLAYAKQKHHIALGEAQELVHNSKPGDLMRVLIVCVLFICIESVRGNCDTAMMHLSSGRAICSQYRRRLLQYKNGELGEIEELFARLDFAACTFANNTNIYPFTLDDFYQTKPHLHTDDFATLAQARATLIDLLRWHLVFIETSQDLPNPSVEELCIFEIIGSAFSKWKIRFDVLINSLPSANQETPSILVLYLWYTFSQITLSTHSPQAPRDEANLPHFKAMLHYSERIAKYMDNSGPDGHFSLELGCSPPLFFVATRCRDPTLRRRAIAALRASPGVEGLWETDGAAAIAERLMQVEEEGLLVHVAADVPRWKRIEDERVQLGIDVGKGRAWIVTPVKDRDGNDTGERTESIDWEPRRCGSL